MKELKLISSMDDNLIRPEDLDRTHLVLCLWDQWYILIRNDVVPSGGYIWSPIHDVGRDMEIFKSVKMLCSRGLN